MPHRSTKTRYSMHWKRCRCSPLRAKVCVSADRLVTGDISNHNALIWFSVARCHWNLFYASDILSTLMGNGHTSYNSCCRDYACDHGYSSGKHHWTQVVCSTAVSFSSELHNRKFAYSYEATRYWPTQYGDSGSLFASVRKSCGNIIYNSRKWSFTPTYNTLVFTPSRLLSEHYRCQLRIEICELSLLTSEIIWECIMIYFPTDRPLHSEVPTLK